MPTDNNISLKENNKIGKYKDLEINDLKTTIVPVIFRELGMIQKGRDKFNKMILGSSSLYEIPKIALCGIAHHYRKVISM